jgi:hypothetical protein
LSFNQRQDWPVPIPGASVVTAREYLTDAASVFLRRIHESTRTAAL